MPCSYLGNIEIYEVKPEDKFIVDTCNVFYRKNYHIKNKGASFYTYKHSSAIVSLIFHISIGHEASVGVHSRVSIYAH